jgi:hypothetical protein
MPYHAFYTKGGMEGKSILKYSISIQKILDSPYLPLPSF